MTLEQIALRLEARIHTEIPLEITEFYAGDFLSRVMGKAPSGSGWLTVMNNVNVAGVAVLAEIALIILCEGTEPDPRLREKCAEEGISLMTTPLAVYESCKRL